MSKLTDKIEAEITYFDSINRSTLRLRTILADVRELEHRTDDAEQAAIGIHAMRLDDIRVNAMRGLDEAGQVAAIRAAKRETYEHAIRIVRNARWERKTKRSVVEGVLCAAIDALDTEGNSDE